MKSVFGKLYLILFFAMMIGSGAIGYFIYQNYQLKAYELALEEELFQTRADFTLTVKDLRTIIGSTSQELAVTMSERDDFEQKYNEELDKVNSLDSQIKNIQNTVGILEKWSQTDPELLKKYSKVYFLNENYVPKTFVKIESKYTYDTKRDYLIYSKIWPFLQNLLTAAESDNVDIKIISAYRSFGTQSGLKSSYTMVYGSGANKFSADQGYSEHQLGTTVDFTTSEIGADYSAFEKTPAYQWLSENGYKYGFILSYPKDNGYYQFEPWHWRFASRSLAEKLHREGKNFYDLDQRDIDQYIISFFD